MTAVYEIEPEGDVEEDEDGHIGSYKCRRAEIVLASACRSRSFRGCATSYAGAAHHDAAADWGFLHNELDAAA